MPQKMKNTQPETIVVKIGTLTLTGPDGNIDDKYMKDFVAQLASQHARGERIVVVTSGAIRTGCERLGISPERLGVADKQAAAAVGQGLLMERYTRHFTRHGIITAQVLLTRDVISRRKQYINARNTFLGLLERGVVPIVNENDTVAVDEIKFGDNDSLSILTAMLVEADALILLSDVTGLYDDDPKINPGAKLICEVHDIDERIAASAKGTRSVGATGGMTTKIAAARQAVSAGIRTIIAHGREPNVIKNILEGRCAGTTFFPKAVGLHGKKRWIAFGPVPKGKITVNAGAKKMIVTKGKSLLPVGVTAVSGRFDQGACVELTGEDGAPFARGLTNYSAAQVKKIMGLQSDKIEKALGFKPSDDVVHRDNLVLL